MVVDLGGARHRLVHGDGIGRGERATLRLEDRRISVAHALVSLRPEGLSLLALRGVVTVDGEPADEVVLRAGQRVELAPGVVLGVVEVVHGTGAIALEPTDRLDGDAPLRLVAHFDTVWLSGAGLPRPWMLTGQGALIVIELVRAGEPVAWFRLARALWPVPVGRDPAEHKERVRARWYQATARLRRELESAGLDRPLVLTRSGRMTLAVLPGDQVIDHTDE